MVRRFANQVHSQVARLMRGNLVIKQEPVWFQAVLDYPPLPLPPKAPPTRTNYDLLPKQPSSSSRMREPKNQPKDIYYVEDDIRRQFFRDHPFEAFRPTTLVENGFIADEHPIKGLEWTRLRQRGRNPSPEDAVKYALNLYQYHNIPLSEAYTRAVAQFRSLRAEHHIATTFAAQEATQLGATFAPTQTEHAFEKEKKALETWERKAELDSGALIARKRWKAIVDRKNGIDQWSSGQEYTRLWREGVRPNYLAATQPLQQIPAEDPNSPEAIASSVDFLAINRA